MDEDSYMSTQEALENLPENFNVLEEQIDVQPRWSILSLPGNSEWEGIATFSGAAITFI